MANILYETIGRNYQVPGLPYEEKFEYVKPVVFDDVPTRKDVVDLLSTADSKTLVNPWSLQVIRGFRDYLPTTFKRITHKMPSDTLEELFGVDANWIPESDRILLQLQCETEAKGATLDAAIVHDRMSLGTVVNKAHTLNRLYMIGRLYGHLNERPGYPFLFGDLSDKTTWHDALSDMKLQFIDYIREMPLGSTRYKIRTRKADVGADEIKDYPFIEWFKQKLGDNFMGALLYGSAARTKDPALYSDFDNWVRVHDVQAAHKVLRGTCPAVLDGKVVEGDASHAPGAKHLGVHLFPEDDEYLFRHILFLHDSKEFRKHTRILYGQFPFPVQPMEEIIERGLSHAHLKLKTIAGSLNWGYSAPEKIVGSPNLFEFIAKNKRFFLQNMLNAIATPQFRDKQVLDALLRTRGMEVQKYRDDPDYIREALISTFIDTFALQKEFVAYSRTPKLDFLGHTSVAADPAGHWDRLDDLG